MLKSARIQRYKSLYDVTIDFEPLTVLIGPNGSGKSNVCEALSFIGQAIDYIATFPPNRNPLLDEKQLSILTERHSGIRDFTRKRWRGEVETPLSFELTFETPGDEPLRRKFVFPSQTYIDLPLERTVIETLSGAKTYDFVPASISATSESASSMDRSGYGVADALASILLNDRHRFDELEARLQELIPSVSRIILERSQSNQFLIFLQDGYSDYRIPATDVSDGTLRILALLTSLYGLTSPGIICFEEPENGIHPWLLNRIIELLNLVSTEGIGGNATQVVITTHSPAMLNYFEPEQLRSVELEHSGKTVVHRLPTDGERFARAMEVFEGELGEMWFTDIFGGNP